MNFDIGSIINQIKRRFGEYRKEGTSDIRSKTANDEIIATWY